MRTEEKTFRDTLVGDVYELIVKRPTTVARDAKISKIIEGMLENTVSRKVYVIDEEGMLLGMVNTDTILRLIGYRTGVRDKGALSFYRFLRDTLKERADSVMVKGRTVTKDTKLSSAMRMMIEEHLNDLPVVDADGMLIGELVSQELFMEGRRVFDPKDPLMVEPRTDGP